MPFDRLVLILVLVVIAAGLTVFVASFVAAAVELPALGAAISIPILLMGYVLWRVIAERLANREDDHYDRLDH